MLLLPQAGTAVQGRPAAPETARMLQQKYDRVKAFTADFTHTYEGGILKKKTSVERGTVQIKKPGRMRWDYTAPDKKLFVSDGRKVYSYIPADKQVVIADMPAGDEATTAVLFLTGRGNLTRDFTVSYVNEGDGADTWALRLDPRQPQRDYDWLILVVDRQSLQIRALTAADNQGGRSTFAFTNYRENVEVSDKTFEFKIPRGVDVITAGDR
jgi:outer membrane lipoprotein carrier protein